MRKYFGILLLLGGGACNPAPDLEPGFTSRNRRPIDDRLEIVGTYGGSGEDIFKALVAVPGGGLAALGYSDSMDGDLQGKTYPGNDFWLVRMDETGQPLWSRSYGGSGDDKGQALLATDDGGFAIAGYAMSADGDASHNEGFHDNWVLKLDASGEIQWEKSIGYAGHDHAYDLLQTPDGGYYLAGFLDVTASGGAGGKGYGQGQTAHGVGEFWIIKLDASGKFLWRRYFGGSNNDRAHAMALAPDGGLVVAGFSESQDFDISAARGSYDFWVIKLDATGALRWERSYGGSGIDIAYDVASLPGGGYLVTGQTYSKDGDVSVSHGGGDAWVIRIDEGGNLLSETTFGGERFDVAYHIHLLGQETFLMSGSSRSGLPDGKESDFWVVAAAIRGPTHWEIKGGTTGIDELRSAVKTQDGKLLFAGSSGIGETADAVVLEYRPGYEKRKPRKK